jgi:hypothetical protein
MMRVRATRMSKIGARSRRGFGLVAFAALLAGLGPATFVGTRQAAASLVPRDVIVIAGQSNATGWGANDVDPSGYDFTAWPYASDAYAQDQMSWYERGIGIQVAPVPIGTPRPDTYENGTPTFGLENGLVRQLYADGHRQPLTVVNVSFGGSSLATSWNPAATNPVYSDFMKMANEVNAVVAYDAGQGQQDRLIGFYWFQGETDAVHLSQALSYQSNLTNFIGAVRDRLPGATGLPFTIVEEDVSAICAQDDPSIQLACSVGNSSVRAADDAVANAVPDVAECDTADLPRLPSDAWHLGPLAELSAGLRAAMASESLLP